MILHPKCILWVWNTDCFNLKKDVSALATVTGNFMNFSRAVHTSLNVDMTKWWSTITIFASLERCLGLWWRQSNARYRHILANTTGTRYKRSVHWWATIFLKSLPISRPWQTYSSDPLFFFSYWNTFIGRYFCIIYISQGICTLSQSSWFSNAKNNFSSPVMNPSWLQLLFSVKEQTTHQQPSSKPTVSKTQNRDFVWNITLKLSIEHRG